MSKFSGTDAVLQNLRKRLAVQGAHDAGTSISNSMSSVSMLSFLKPIEGITTASFRVATTNPTAETLASSIKSFLNNELEVIAGSLKVLEKSDFFTTVSSHLKRAHVSRPVSPDGKLPNGFVSLSKNIFMEDRDSTTWKLVEAGGQKMLVRDSSVETDEDMEQILSSLSSAGHEYSPAAKTLYAHASSIIEDIETGSLVEYVEDDGVSLAFAIEGVGNDGQFGSVAMQGNAKYKDIHASTIVRVIPSSEYLSQIFQPPTDSVALASGGRVDANVLTEYYRKVYGYNKEFFNQWAQRIRNSFV